VNNWYAVEELTHQHQAELEREAGRDASARSTHRRSARPGVRSLFAGVVAGLRAARHRTAPVGHLHQTRSLHNPRLHLPHRHVPAAR
jgi:hypothetical protein